MTSSHLSMNNHTDLIVVSTTASGLAKTDVLNLSAKLEVAAMSVVFVISSFGNSIVVLVVSKKRRMQSVINWLILNLAVADLAVSVICIPLEIPMIINQRHWLYGRYLCPVFYPLQTATIYGSVFTLVALSLTRYWAVLHPFRKQPTVIVAKILIGIIWIASFLVVIPYILSLEYVEGTGECVESFTKNQANAYTIIIFVFQYVLPLAIISVAYVLICRDLRRNIGEETLPINTAKRLEAKQILHMLLTVTFTFAMCVLPYHLVFIYSDFIKENFEHKNVMVSWSYILLYSNSAINPIIYNAFNSRFRNAFLELWQTLLAHFLRVPVESGQGFFSKTRPSIIPFLRRGSRGSRLSRERSREAVDKCISSTAPVETCHYLRKPARTKSLTVTYLEVQMIKLHVSDCESTRLVRSFSSLL